MCWHVLNVREDCIDYLKKYGRLPLGSLKGQSELMQEFNTMRAKLSKMKDLEARYDDIVLKK